VTKQKVHPLGWLFVLEIFMVYLINMRKTIFFLLILSLFYLPKIAFGFVSSEVINHQAPAVYFYPQEFDKLVLDLTVPSGTCCGTDTLKAITIQNNGLAIDVRDIEKFKLWADEGKTGFQGMGIDAELGTFIFYSQNNSWYLKDLNQAVPQTGLRIFVSAEIGRGATNGTTFQMKIPQLSDQNQSGDFNLGDLGIFLESKNNGPNNGAVINSYQQTIYASTYDELAPKSVVTNPKDNATITNESYKILGVARDQGGSVPKWVKISINDVWHDATPTSSNYTTWEYNWQNIAEGTYNLKTQSADWLGNVETAGEGITVQVAFPAPPAEEPVIEEEIIEEEEEPSEEKPISEMTIAELKAKIAEIQEQIIELLTQLIQFYQSQIAQLQ